jgi:hypothetical protein
MMLVAGFSRLKSSTRRLGPADLLQSRRPACRAAAASGVKLICRLLNCGLCHVNRL